MKTLQRLLIIALCLLIPSSAMTWGVVGMSGGVASVAASDCTGACIFSWHCEDLTVTTGTPAGCSAGDAIATAGGPGTPASISATQKHDGTNSLSIPATGSSAQFDISAGDIFNKSAGTMTFSIYVTTWAAGPVCRIATDGANFMTISLTGTADMKATYCNDADQYVATTTASMALNTWYTVTVKWTVALVNPNLSIQVCDTNGANCSTAGVNNTNFATMASTPTSIAFGDYSEVGWRGFIDKIKIYNAVQ